MSHPKRPIPVRILTTQTDQNRRMKGGFPTRGSSTPRRVNYRFFSDGYWDCRRRLTTLVASSAIVAACAPLPIEGTLELPQQFNLNCSAHLADQGPLSWQPTSWPAWYYHIDLSQGLVNYSIPLSTTTPIQLAWTSYHEGYMYRVAINRITGALYEMQLFPSGLRTGHDMSGICELIPPPPPQPKF